MGKVWMPGGGGGADLDVITASAADILAGKMGVDKEGDPVAGTMPNRGTVSTTLTAGQVYTIPAGYHNGSGKITATDLASQTPGNAVAGDIIKPKTAWVSGGRVTGTLEDRAKQTGAVSVSASSSAGYVRIPVGAYRAKTNANYPEVILNQSQLDYIARQRFGGVAFNGATFDGLVLSGVAKGSINNKVLEEGAFGCRWHGSDSNNYSSKHIAYTPSINLSLFKQLKVTFHVVLTGSIKGRKLYSSITVNLIKVDGVTGNRKGTVIKNAKSWIYDGGNSTVDEYDRIIDVDLSGIAEQGFIYIIYDQMGGAMPDQTESYQWTDVKRVELIS